MAYAPDDSGMTWRDKDKDRNKGGNNKGGGAGEFMPGHISGIAQDLSTSTGKSEEAMKEYLKGLYSPVKMGGFNFGKGGGGGNGGGGKNNNGGGKPDIPGRPDFDVGIPYGPRRANAPVTFPLGLQNETQPKQAAAPQPQAQIPSQLSPELINLIRARMMGG